jgi:HSP20 family protein
MSRRGERLPVSAVALLRQEVSDLFQRLSAYDRSERLPAGEWCPPVDVFESRDRLVIVVEVPGLPPEALHVAFRGGALVLSGERRARKSGGEVSFLCFERPHGHFQRTIPLEVPLDVSRARATLAGGLLTVTVPRLRERRGQETVVPIEREPTE